MANSVLSRDDQRQESSTSDSSASPLGHVAEELTDLLLLLSDKMVGLRHPGLGALRILEESGNCVPWCACDCADRYERRAGTARAGRGLAAATPNRKVPGQYTAAMAAYMVCPCDARRLNCCAPH